MVKRAKFTKHPGSTSAPTAMERPEAAIAKPGVEQRPAGIGQEQPANPPAIERVGAFGEQLPGAPSTAPSLRSKPEEPAPSPPSVDYSLVSIGEGAQPLVPAFCFAPVPVPLEELGLDIRYDNESRHYYVAEATLEKVLEQCNAKRQECERHGLLSPAHKVTLPREAREAFKIPLQAERCAVAIPAGSAYPSAALLAPRQVRLRVPAEWLHERRGRDRRGRAGRPSRDALQRGRLPLL